MKECSHWWNKQNKDKRKYKRENVYFFSFLCLFDVCSPLDFFCACAYFTSVNQAKGKQTKNILQMSENNTLEKFYCAIVSFYKKNSFTLKGTSIVQQY